MPAMIRKKGKATKIALAILGPSQNKPTRKTPKQEQQDQRLNFEDTQRVR
jgi:hypothetical protein